MGPVAADPAQLILNRTWRPQLAITGAAGLPNPNGAGNVQLPYTTVKLSLRLPPTLDVRKARDSIKALLEQSSPYGAEVELKTEALSPGWDAPHSSSWLQASLTRASETAFGAPPAYMGEGGTIPFMAMLAERFPRAQFVVTGVLGPHANAHGPNEFLHIPTAKRVSAVVAHVLSDQLDFSGRNAP
jgi:acetylornithine deacetylase/succinyl-diaminopimelate desuccinylase-like protein